MNITVPPIQNNPEDVAESPRRSLSITRSTSKSTAEEPVNPGQRKTLAKAIGVQPRIDPDLYQISNLPHYLGPAPSLTNNGNDTDSSSSSSISSNNISISSSNSSSSTSNNTSNAGNINSNKNTSPLLSSFNSCAGVTSDSHDGRGSSLLWGGCAYYGNNENKEELNRLLRTARSTGALKSVGDTYITSDEYSESDEITLQLLQQCKNNIGAATQCIVSGSSAGCDEIFLKKNIDIDSRNRRGVARRITSRETAASVSRPSWLPGFGTNKNSTHDFNGNETTTGTTASTTTSGNISTSRGYSSGHNNNHNKIAKRKWNEWADDVRPVLNFTGRSTKPEFETLASLLHKSYCLPEIIATPGTSDQHLYETMLTLQSTLLDQVQKNSSWISQSHDLLSGSVFTRNASTGKGGTLLLEQHITRSKNLGVKVAGIDGLKHSAKAIRAWKLRAANLMEAMKSGRRLKIDLVTNLLREVSLLAYDPVETAYFKRIVEEAKGLSAYITRLFPHVSWSPLEKGGMTLILRKTASTNMGNMKATLPDLRRYLDSINACPIHLIERDRLMAHIAFAEQWIVKCTNAIDSQNRNLKELASLASEAESIPVNLSQHVSKLADAITSAQDWMNRVRKAVPRSSKTRKGKGEDHVDLTTLKSLLSEGSSSTGNSSSNSGSASALSNVRDIVNKAEEWLGRARISLNNRKNVETDELKKLLREAEDIPVAMNEVIMLQVEIESREWHDNLKELLEPSLPNKDKMTYDGLVELLDEADRIRFMLPSELRDQHIIILENEAKSIEHDVKEWISHVDTALSPNSHTSLDDLEYYVNKGKAYPIDFEGRLEKLEQKINAAKEWSVKAKEMLKMIDQALVEELGETNARVWTHAAVVAANENRIGKITPSLKLLVATAHEIKMLRVTTEEEKIMRGHISKAQKWLERAKQMLPKKQRKKSAAYVKPSMDDFIQICEDSRSLADPCIDIVLSLCAEMDNSKIWLAEAAELLKSSNAAMASAMILVNNQSTSVSTNQGELQKDPQMDVVREYYEKYVDLKKKANSSLAVSSPEERIILVRIAAAEWAENADTALTHTGSDHLPLEIAKKLKKEGQELMKRDQQFKEWPSYATEDADGGGWRMVTHEKLLQRIVAATLKGDEITASLKKQLKSDASNQSTLENMENLLKNSLQAQCVDTKYLNLFRQRVRKARICHEHSRKIFLKNELPSIEQVQKVLNQAKMLNLEIPNQKKLEFSYEQAISWEKRLRDSGIESGSAPVELLRELLKESKLIPIDLSAHVQVLEQATQEYCLCCAPSDGWMIGCEHCDDWFHGRCIGLKETDNVENYVCPRCVVHGFFKDNVRAFRHIHKCYAATPRSPSIFTFSMDKQESQEIPESSNIDSKTVLPEPPVFTADSSTTAQTAASNTVVANAANVTCKSVANESISNEAVQETSNLKIDTTKSYDAPSGHPCILDLLERADKLLCHATDEFKTVEMFHCDEAKMEEFFSICKFIMESCPQCELTSRVAEWLKLQIWVSSALNILSRRPELKAVIELLNTCVHIPMPPDEGGLVLAPLRRLAMEGQEWGDKIESVIRNERRDKEGLMSRKDLEETKRVHDYVINMPTVHSLEEVLKVFFKQEKDKYEKVHGDMNKKRSAKRSSGASKSRRNKKAKTTTSSSSSSSSSSLTISSSSPSSVSNPGKSPQKKKRESNSNDVNLKSLKRRKLTAASKVTVGTKLKVRIIEDEGPKLFTALVKE
jgi:hypothetical protein